MNEIGEGARGVGRGGYFRTIQSACDEILGRISGGLVFP